MSGTAAKYDYSMDLDDSDCLVCLQRVNEPDGMTTICNHTFHRSCINRWLSRSDCCPKCGAVLQNTVSDVYPYSNYGTHNYVPVPTAPVAPHPLPPTVDYINVQNVRNNLPDDREAQEDPDQFRFDHLDDNRCSCGVFRCCYLTEGCRSLAYMLYGTTAIILLFILLDLILDKKEIHDTYYIVGCVVVGAAILFNVLMCIFIAVRLRCRNCVWYTTQPPIQM